MSFDLFQGNPKQEVKPDVAATVCTGHKRQHPDSSAASAAVNTGSVDSVRLMLCALCIGAKGITVEVVYQLL